MYDNTPLRDTSPSLLMALRRATSRWGQVSRLSFADDLFAPLDTLIDKGREVANIPLLQLF